MADVAVGDRDELDVVPGFRPEGGSATALVLGIVGMSAEADDSQPTIVIRLVGARGLLRDKDGGQCGKNAEAAASSFLHGGLGSSAVELGRARTIVPGRVVRVGLLVSRKRLKYDCEMSLHPGRIVCGRRPPHDSDRSANPLAGLFAALVLVGLAGCDVRDRESAAFPARPIKVVVPFAAGGGSDTFARIIQATVNSESMLAEKLVIINVPGAGGTIGSRRVKNAWADGHTILLLHEGILTAKYSGQATFGPEGFEPICGTGEAPQVIAVAESSPHRDLNELMQAATTRPEELVYAANLGAPSHFAGLLLEQKSPGARFRYTQAGGGAKRFAAILGEHVEVSSFSLAEYVQFKPAGLRALALLAEHRLAELPDLPTAREQGFDCVNGNMQFWWAPKGTDPARTQILAEAIRRAMQDDKVLQKLAEMRVEPRFLIDEALDAELDRRTTEIASVARRPAPELPDFPGILLACTVGLGTVLAVSRRVGVSPPSQLDESQSAKKPVIFLLLMTLGYIVCLQATPIGFRAATVIYVWSAGVMLAHFSGVLASGRRRPMVVLSCLALVFGVGLHYLFTRVLVVDLP